MDGVSAEGQHVVGQFLGGEQALDAALYRLAELAMEELPGADAATITVVRDGAPRTPAFTDKTGLALDEKQYEIGDGPCLAAIRQCGLEEFPVEMDGRWPSFAKAAAEAGVVGVLSVALVGDDEEAVGGLNVYSRSVARFDGAARDQAVRLAAVVGIAVANALRYDAAATMASHLEQALASRGVIEQAKGVLMAAQRCSPEQAFELLRRASQRENRKLRDIAAEIVERVQLP